MPGIGKIGPSIRRELTSLQQGVRGYFKDARARNSAKTPATNQTASPQQATQQSNRGEPSGSVATGLSSYPSSQQAVAADNASGGGADFSHSEYEQAVAASFEQSSEVSDTESDLAQKVVLAELDKVIKDAEDEIDQAENAQAKTTEVWLDSHTQSLVNSITDAESKEQVLDFLKDEETSSLQRVMDAAIEESHNERLNGNVELADLLIEFSEDIKKKL